MEIIDYVVKLGPPVGISLFYAPRVNQWDASIAITEPDGRVTTKDKRGDSVSTSSNTWGANPTNSLSNLAKAISGRVLTITIHNESREIDVPPDLEHTLY